jgi:hypothetical protein
LARVDNVAFEVDGSVEGHENIKKEYGVDHAVPNNTNFDLEADLEWNGNNLVEDK